ARFAGIPDPILIPEDEQVDRAVLAASPLITTAPRAPARHAAETLSDRFLPQRRRIRKRGVRRGRVASASEERSEQTRGMRIYLPATVSDLDAARLSARTALAVTDGGRELAPSEDDE